MAKIYSNENFPFPAVEHLRELGHDVQTSAESGMAGFAIPDDKVLEHAVRESRVLVTLNRRHFIKLHNDTNGQHCGIVICTVDPDFYALADRVHLALNESMDMKGRLLRVNRPSST